MWYKVLFRASSSTVRRTYIIFYPAAVAETKFRLLMCSHTHIWYEKKLKPIIAVSRFRMVIHIRLPELARVTSIIQAFSNFAPVLHEDNLGAAPRTHRNLIEFEYCITTLEKSFHFYRSYTVDNSRWCAHSTPSHQTECWWKNDKWK